ncbi:dicarboxylate/amino acid:cation symporter [Phenylobacterium deserti]|uniref:Dicarboxylate/amino acid:cation symporter n=1 Tax=Phenylobacterium deserti TaxID=1914756 RepID=A0A328AEZ9_9CAUL|nr:cation:dicarboxylase symporter family transporter [Phenylobacterium deserti]RAK51368.1 dicarboxylate/amino acid:cation symporter [Phenylobacterium deserti]
MTLTLRILAALVAGLLSGAALAAADVGWLPAAAGFARAAGGLWLDALRMTIVPLVFALLVSGVASAAGAARAGRMAARTFGFFAVLLLAASAFAAIVVPMVLSVAPIPVQAVAPLREALGAPSANVPGLPPFGEWLRSFIPVNPVGAAAEGAMVPLVIFGLVFGLAATRIEPELRDRIVGLFEAVVRTMLVIVGWVLWAAPAGVLALSFVVGASAGLGAAGGLLHYVLTVCGVCLAVTLAMYPFARVAGGVPLMRFARAVGPAQLVAFSTQSSIASLPAMTLAVQQLAVPVEAGRLVLPLAVSLFRITSAVANMTVAIYAAALFGAVPGPAQLATGAVVAAIVSLAAVGLPSQVSFFTAISPVCLAMGVPLQALPLLLAVESIPDIFRTVGNVTADVAVTAAVGRKASARDGEGGARTERPLS